MKKAIILTAVFFLFANSLFSQSFNRLQTGKTTSGRLEAGEYHWYTITPATSGILVVHTTGNLDTLLEVYNENSVKFFEADDWGMDANARAEVYVEGEKTYMFKLSDLNGTGGEFGIRANLIQPVEIKIGSTVRGELTSEDTTWFMVKPARAGRLTVETLGVIDTWIEVMDSFNRPLGEDDDSGDKLNARVTFQAEANKLYIIAVLLSDGGGGNFNIRADMK